jgi:hypothetical protein
LIRNDERTLRQYVAARRDVLVPREAFVRAAYAPGNQSQFDFSPMSAVALCRLARRLHAFGGLTRTSIFDNASTAVKARLARSQSRRE